MEVSKMNDSTYNLLVQHKESSGKYLATAFQYESFLETQVENTSGIARENYQRKLDDLKGRINYHVENRIAFLEAVVQEKQRRARAVTPMPAKPALEEITMVA
jgi:hypothetical protein